MHFYDIEHFIFQCRVAPICTKSRGGMHLHLVIHPQSHPDMTTKHAELLLKGILFQAASYIYMHTMRDLTIKYSKELLSVNN